VDANIQRKIVEAIHPEADDEIVEIGPGRGALTRHLAGACRSLILVEVDDELVEALEEVYGERADVRIVHRSVLDVPLSELSDSPEDLKVVGNIPYNLTSPILFHVLRRPRPRTVVLMVQREVADRIVAEPGTKAYGALSVGVRSVADPERLFRVPPGAFRPVPKVDSVVIRVTPHDRAQLSTAEEGDLRALTRAAFGWRRKQFQRILRDHPLYAMERSQVDALQAETDLDMTRRPESFDPNTFIRLSRALARLGMPRTGEAS
jgi:16S rRNA (adenine1518-N6/adenine1519-N6)-dimethyltransferase